MNAPSMAEITKAVAAEFGVTPATLRSRRATMRHALPRMVAMCLSCEVAHLSTTEVGRFFERDHTTVLHATRRVPFLMSRDAELSGRIAAICNQLARRPSVTVVASYVAPVTIEATFARWG
jgi:chromosomal replication initiator protein